MLSLDLLKVLQIYGRKEGNNQGQNRISSWFTMLNTCVWETVTACDYSQLCLLESHLHVNRYKIPFTTIFQTEEDIKEWDFLSHLSVHKSNENSDSLTIF